MGDHTAMLPYELLSEFSIKIYEPPLNEIRDNGEITDLSNPIAVMMLVQYFQTEVEMGGIGSFLGNRTGVFANETVEALKNIGCDSQAATLKQILTIAAAAGMTHDAIQEDRSQLPEFAVTSFSDLHGDKWADASDKIEALDSEIDYDELSDRAEKFVELHAEAFQEAVSEE